MPCLQSDDGQPRLRKPRRAEVMAAAVVRPAVPEACRHDSQQLGLWRRAVCAQETGYTAHCRRLGGLGWKR
jgi:hypothetical protein